MGIEFQEDQNEHFRSRTVFGQPQTPKIVFALLKTGIVKSEKAAGILIFILVVLSLCISVVIIVLLSRPQPVRYDLSPEVIETLPDEVKAKIYEANNKR